MSSLYTIPPEKLAMRIKDGCFAEIPSSPETEPARWREMLWWLEWVSHQPGGLYKLAEDIFEDVRTSDRKGADLLKGKESELVITLCQMCSGQIAGFYQDFKVKNLFNFLFYRMERHAADIATTIAQTEVSKIVFRELEFSISQGVPVPIVGESRIGKTSPAGVWCGMRPGRAKLVAFTPIKSGPRFCDGSRRRPGH